uniref:Uncharacterized protein n=1 Tax=Anguilla anguilla TaxID=7936 RepID=A0A0E9WZX3_ANGAN
MSRMKMHTKGTYSKRLDQGVHGYEGKPCCCAVCRCVSLKALLHNGRPFHVIGTVTPCLAYLV